jgi:hypothetical protein
MQRVVVPLLFAVVFPFAANSEPASSLPVFWQGLRACSTRGISRLPEAAGSELTVMFAIKSDGSLQGQPRITHSRLVGDRSTQQGFVADALGALGKCFPLPITAGMGGAIAGRPIRLRIVNRPRERRA